MNLFADAFAWLADPANWSGAGSIPQRLGEHLWVSAVVLVIAAVIALPVGAWVGHTGRGREPAVMLSGGLRALPTLGVLTLFGTWLGIGLQAPVIALVILAIPPLLAGAYAGFESVDRRTIDAARAMGMRELQIVGKVELPWDCRSSSAASARPPCRSSRRPRSRRTSPTRGSAASSSAG